MTQALDDAELLSILLRPCRDCIPIKAKASLYKQENKSTMSRGGGVQMVRDNDVSLNLIQIQVP